MGFDPITSAVIQLVVTTAISWVIAPKPKKPNIPEQQQAQGILVNKASNNTAIPVIYGRRQIGISRVFVESSGTDNQYLYIAGVICEGGGNGIESVDEIYVNDKLVTWSGALTDGTVRTVNSSDTNFYKDGSLISVQAFYGLDNQSVSSILDESSNWGSNHKLSGVAYLAFKFTWNQDAFNSLPEIKVVVKGKKVYDPRLDSTKGGSGSHRQDTASTWTYSSNSALCLLDYLRNSRYGKGLPNTAFETNYDSFKTSANLCETQVAPYSGGSNINLFETNIVLDTEQKLIDNVYLANYAFEEYYFVGDAIKANTSNLTDAAARQVQLSEWATKRKENGVTPETSQTVKLTGFRGKTIVLSNISTLEGPMSGKGISSDFKGKSLRELAGNDVYQLVRKALEIGIEPRSASKSALVAKPHAYSKSGITLARRSPCEMPTTDSNALDTTTGSL